ncbi:hypothetical protein FO488_11875 [Geobacter sp. FeAm09]|uniref:hypothetical protein n=1 Tax=Geobacter sp. FeAm09 TaxID=2597769 RepID=UPI0011EFD20E|nr:hypothetical protein [Geobacter sp. FeAm09]QEM68786.1 hypothetical protein FO488_11875 [Geobacter sp. FeAm09]
MNGRRLALSGAVFSLPQPIFLVIEDVGWWQGYDGAAQNEPFRTGFCRRHCLDDYRALTRLARRLSMRLAIGLVLGEWDRTNFLKDVQGATWMGTAWDNSINQGPWLDETAQYLNDHRQFLEIALHGICHEFWQDGQMHRTEFHDASGQMRPEAVVRRHLEAYATLLSQNGLGGFPRFFIPPALYHSFGNGRESMQAILKSFGIDYVATRFSKARLYAKPQHPRLAWECGIGLVERGLSPVNWDVAAAPPRLCDDNSPILALHWANLLHPDAERNHEVVDAWADMLATKAAGLDFILAEELAACWCQAAAYFLADFRKESNSIVIDLGAIPTLPCFTGAIALKIRDEQSQTWHVHGANVVGQTTGEDSTTTRYLLPEPRSTKIVISRNHHR